MKEKQEYSDYAQYRKWWRQVRDGQLDVLEQAMKKAKATTAEIPKDRVLWGWRPGFVARRAL